MCCLVTVLAFLGPRASIIAWYLLNPNRWQEVFDGFLVPCLGFMLLPWTTLMVVFLTPGGGINGFEWVMVALAVFGDLSSYGGGFRNRKRIRRSRRS